MIALARTTNMKKRLLLFSLIFATAFSCSKDDDDTSSLTKEAISNYADLVYANYSDALSTAKALQEKINTLTTSPSQVNLEQAKAAWINAREYYGQTEAFRFYGGPIDNDQGPEGLMNAWPLDEVYIDYVEGAPNAGIINNAADYPQITKEVLSDLNEKDGEANISTGYHAIEFLLWGQDLSAGPGGGSRPYTDYSIAANADRRKQYLTTVTDLLEENLQTLVDAWKPATSNYRAEFVSKPNESLQHIFTGLGKLSKGELAGERMFVAWDEKDKEHEHSCFSDNTHRDIVNNARGIQNVFLGKYKKADGSTVDGVGIDDLIKVKNSTLATEVTGLIATSVTLAEAIQAPFDQEILASPGRERVKATIDALRTQADKLVDAGKLFGFTIDPEVQ
jgi:putative iron-regulated protein